MSKILGLDLGTNSIGWAVVEKENEKFSLVDKGVRIFQRGYGDEHQDSSRAADRTLHRSTRKLYNRRKGRKIELLKLLGAEYHPFTSEELKSWHKDRKYPIRTEIQEWFKLNPYELRNSGINGNILSQQELGRVFYHYTQKRGFKSNKKDVSSIDTETKDKDLGKDIILDREYRKKNGEKLLSEKLYTDLSEGKRIRNKSEENNISRITIENDFKELCRRQGLEKDFVEDIRKTIFDARPLKSQKGNIGKCIFEKGKPRCPISSVDFEEYRMYSFINNIKIKRKDEQRNGFKPLSNQKYFKLDIEKDIVPLFLRKSKTFKFEDIRNRLSKLDSSVIYEFNYKDNTTVTGCPVSAHLKSIFGDGWKDVNFSGVNSQNKNVNYNIFDIWHLVFDHYMQDKEDEPLLKIAQDIFKLDIKKAQKLLSAPIQQGYANLSFKAIKKILPYLKKGIRLDQAILLANIPAILGIKKEDKLPDDIFEDIQDIFKDFNKEKVENIIVNDCISIFRSQEKGAHADYQLTDDDKNIVENQAIKKHGEATWQGLTEDDRRTMLLRLEQIFEDQLRKGSVRGQFKKTESIKQKVGQYLIQNLNVSEETTKKLYHPSAIELYPNVEFNKDGLKLLGSPIIDSIKNPLFMRSMCELRKVVNELLKTDTIQNDTQIVIELGRDVNDYNMRKAIERYQRERETENEFYKQLLEEFYKEKDKKKQPSKEEEQRVKFWVEQLEDEDEAENFYKKLEGDTAQYTKKEDRIKLPQYAIEKYRLWKEQKGICPYTHKPIGMADLLNGNKFDFEHTVPLSKSFDNSLANKTIADSHFNRYIKGNKAPFELDEKYKNNVGRFIQRWETKVEELENRIEKLKSKVKGIQDKERKNQNIQERHYLRLHLKYWKTKVNNFKVKEINDSFKNRQFIDISIINKYALMYLKSAFDNASNISSRFIDEYRKITGYKKNRNYHTHHVIDAIYCACSVDFARRKPEALKKLEVYYKVLNQHRKAVWFDKAEKDKSTRDLKQQLDDATKILIPFDKFHDLLNCIGNDVIVSRRFQDNLKKQTKKKIRERGSVVHRAASIDENGKVLEWKYKTDIHGRKIPVKGKKNDENPDFVLNYYTDNGNKKVEVLTNYPEFSESTIYVQGYLYVKDKTGKVCFEKEARYTWHNDKEGHILSGTRALLHKESLYGMIKRPIIDNKNGKTVLEKNIEFEDWYVKRVPVDKLTTASLKNIVDDGIRDRILDNGGLKNVRSKGVIVLPATANLKQMKIKAIRCRQVKAKGFLTGIPLKKNTHISQKHSHRINRFGIDHKQMTYVDNGGNYQLGIYSDGKNYRYKFLNNLDAGCLLMSVEQRVKVPDNEFFLIRGKKKYLELKQVLLQNKYILLLAPNESKDDINWDMPSQLIQRLYEIKGFGESGKYAVIFCLFNQSGEKISDLSPKDGIFEIDKPLIKYRKFLHTNFNALIEDVDFKISTLGKITRL